MGSVPTTGSLSFMKRNAWFCFTKAATGYMCPLSGSTWCRSIRRRKAQSRNSISLAVPPGSRGRPARNGLFAIWPRSCSSCTRKESLRLAMPFRPIRSGRRNSKRHSSMKRRPISYRPSRISSGTWNRPCQWTALYVATSDTAKPKLRCARRSKPLRTGSKSPCWRLRPSSAISTMKRSRSDLQLFL